MAINTFFFDGLSGTLSAEAQAALAVDQLTAFYTAIDNTIYSGDTVFPAATIRCYDLEDPEPRAPVVEAPLLLTVGGGNPFPREVALCLSFEAEKLSGVSQGRRRGRIYLGPLSVGISATSVGEARPTLAARDLITTAAATLATSGSDESQWAIFSPTSFAAGASLADSTHDVIAGYVDDAFDTQRRRGRDPTTRSTF